MGREKNHLVHFSELKDNNIFMACIFAFLVFSMSGLPPFGGFFVKLDILVSLLETGHYLLNYILFFFTVINFFYYLRLIKIIFFDSKTNLYNIVNLSNIDNIIEELPLHGGRT